MEIYIKCNPPKTTAQSTSRIFKTKDGRMFVGKNSKGLSTRNELMMLLSQYTPETPYNEPLKVDVQWVYPYLKTTRKRDLGRDIPCTTRPDCDNLMKLLFDSMTRVGFWTDDSIVYDVHFVKKYHEKSGIYIKIEKK